MLKKITMGVYDIPSECLKKKVISRENIIIRNFKTSSNKNKKERRESKTPLNSPITKIKPKKGILDNLIGKSLYNKIPVKRYSPKNSDNNYSIETKRLNSIKYESKDKSFFEEKSKNKSKSKKYRELNSKEKIMNKKSFIQSFIPPKRRKDLIFPKSELKRYKKNNSPNKYINKNLNVNWSFNDTSLNSNINCISFHNKSLKKELNESKNKNNISLFKKVKFINPVTERISKTKNKSHNKSKNKSKSKSKNNNNKDNNLINCFNHSKVEAKPKLFSINNNYCFYNNYSLYIIDEENNLDKNKFRRFSTEKDYIKIINQNTNNEYKIIENLLKLEPRNWYEELIFISNRINKNGEISKNFNEILEKYVLIYNQFNWIIYSLSVYFINILEEYEKNKKDNYVSNYDNGLSNKIETWKNGFKWKNLYIKVIPIGKSKILINEIKALNYFFFEYLQLLDTNSIVDKNYYNKKVQLSNNIIFPLIGYSKVNNLILFSSVLIKPENKNNMEKRTSETYITIEEIIEQNNELINYFNSSNENSINTSTTYKTNVSSNESNNPVNNKSVNINKKIMLQININKYNDLDLESSLGENFYVKDLIQSRLFREINNYNLIKINKGKYLLFNLARFIPKLFDIKFKNTHKFNFYSDFKKEEKFFSLYQNHISNKNIHNIPNKYIKTPEDVLDKIYNMKNNFSSPLNYKEIFINNLYFKIIYEETEQTKKDYKTKTFIDHLFNFESSESLKDEQEKNSYNIHKNNNSNLNKKDEKHYIKGKYVILYDLIEPIKLDYSLIKNFKMKNDYLQINEFFFLITNYFSHFYSWCEMLNKNNFNIKSYSDLKYFMKKYSINTNLLFFSLIYIKNEDISDIIKIHLLIKLIYQIYAKENANSKSLLLTKIELYIKNILYPHELPFGSEKTNFNIFYSEILFHTKILLLKYKLIDDYMSLGLLNMKFEKQKTNRNNIYKQISELIPGFDSPKEFLKHIIFIARKKPFCFLSELEIKLNIIINPYIKFKSSLSLESMKGYLSKKSISFNKIVTYSYVKPIDISGLILVKLLNIYEPNNSKENLKFSIESIDSQKNKAETNRNNLLVFHNYTTNNNKDEKTKKKKRHYKSRRMMNTNQNYSETNPNDLFSVEESIDEFSQENYLDEKRSKIQLSFIDLSFKKKRLTSPNDAYIKNNPQILFWKDICEKISFSLSPICYKLNYNFEEKSKASSSTNNICFLNYLKNVYKITNSEILKNWNECNLNVFQKVHSCTGNSEFALLKTYIYLFIYYYFIKKNKEESKKILSSMKSIFKTGFYRTSFNKLAIFNLFQGLCIDKGSEEFFAKSLMLFILSYGDPRGRNNDSNGIIQFPLWIVCREFFKIKEKTIYEYFREMNLSFEYFESKRNNAITQNNYGKIIDYVNNIKNNISNLLSLNITNKYNHESSNSKINLTYNNILNLKNIRKSDIYEISHNNLSIMNIFNSSNDSGLFISNENFNKNYLAKEKISNYFFPSINNKPINILDEFGNKDFAVYIFKLMQNIFLTRHQIFDNEYINNLIPSDIFDSEISRPNLDDPSMNSSILLEPKLKDLKSKNINNNIQKGINGILKENSFIRFINEQFLDKLSYKKNIPSGVIISFGNNVHNETSHDKYDKNDKLTFPRVVFKLKNNIIENIHSGWEHNVVVSKKGEIFTFGNNQSYQCGLPNQNIFYKGSIPNPTNISQIYDIYAKSVSCGNEHSLILTPNKEVYGIGSNEDGVLGHSDIILKSYKPLLIHFGEKDEYTKTISQISSGTVHNLSLTENGKVFSWGAAMGGQLGHEEKYLIKNSNGKKNYYLSKPTMISTLDDKKIVINKISCGEAHSMALSNTGSVYSWGFGSSGQLGLGFCEDSFEPGKGLINSRRMVPEKININSIKEIQCGKTFSMFINKENKLLACGNNDLGQLGFKSEYMDNKKRHQDLIYPTIIDSFYSSEVLKIACGEGHCLAIINDRNFLRMKSLWSWGNNKFGQIGQGAEVKIGIPSPIYLLSDYCNDENEFEEICCGGFHSLCLIKRKKNINWLFDDFEKKIVKIIDDINL